MEFNLEVLIILAGVLMGLTNIITEVIKKVTWDKLPTNVVVLMIALVLTLCAGAAYAQIAGIAITWYMIVAAIVAGIMVAYAAMFGFDKLKEALQWGKKNGF